MQIFNETLDRVAHSGEAVFATDGADRIILWNKECEALLGFPSRRVIGKPCYEVMCGRDASDNVYCHRNCAVAFQAREKKEDPVRRFPLTVKTGDGKLRRVSSSRPSGFWVGRMATTALSRIVAAAQSVRAASS